MNPSTEQRIESGVRTLLSVIVGLVLFVAGLAGAAWQVFHGKDDHLILFVCVGVAILGALILPGIFTVVKPVLIFIFPNGIPLIGGRRSGDPQPPTGPQ